MSGHKKDDGALRAHKDTSDVTESVGTESQPFERFPELAIWIERLARSRIEGFSLHNWQEFTSALNAAIRSSDAERSGNGNDFPESGKVFPKPRTDEVQSANDALVTALMALANSASVVARWMPYLSESHENAIIAARTAIESFKE